MGILNSDDFYSIEHVLSTIAAEFEKQKDIDAVYADVIYVDWNDTSKLIRYYSSKVFSRGLMRLGFMPAHPTFYCRKSTYEKFALDYSDEKAIRTRKIFRYAQDDKKMYYFDTTYKIAADFENLLRMIFVGRIKTQYIPQQFVTMRTGGASSSGAASHKQINKDHMRAFRENGVYSNYLLISPRYVYKLVELALGRIRR